METRRTDPSGFLASELGAFAPAGGPPVVASRLSVILAAAALAGSIALVVSGGEGALGSIGRTAPMMGLGALGAGLAGRYQAQARSRPGERLGRLGATAGAVLGIASFLANAQQTGSLRLDRFADAYLDLDVLSRLPEALAKGLLHTLTAALFAEILAIAVGMVVALLALSERRRVRYPAIAYVDLVRGLPLIVLTSMVYFGLTKIGLRLEPFTAIVVSLAINASAYCAEIFRAGIQAVPAGQMEAARSLGMPRVVAMRQVVVPQAVRQVIPPLVSEFIALIKDTAIVFSIVGFTTRTADVFGVADTAAAATFSPTPYMAAAVAYLAFTVPLARVVGVLERKLRSDL
jgi:His/Glu/Gln/Arg/opine family amino acid ABC transporter permease subunit